MFCAWPDMPKLCKITSLLFLCNILRNRWGDEIDFLQADKHKSFLQINTIIFDGDGPPLPKFLKWQFEMSLQWGESCLLLLFIQNIFKIDGITLKVKSTWKVIKKIISIKNIRTTCLTQ